MMLSHHCWYLVFGCFLCSQISVANDICELPLLSTDSLIASVFRFYRLLISFGRLFLCKLSLFICHIFYFCGTPLFLRIINVYIYFVSLMDSLWTILISSALRFMIYWWNSLSYSLYPSFATPTPRSNRIYNACLAPTCLYFGITLVVSLLIASFFLSVHFSIFLFVFMYDVAILNGNFKAWQLTTGYQ